jgi:asparagine synthase (glutamine-hydrolysing)
MCGIYGSTLWYSDETIRQKLATIQFRGPDYSNFIRSNGVILGHNRLAIIDLDLRSNQPFKYHHLHIVFNGEIYNYQSIRNKLLKKGYLFKTTSDTEVICAAYLAYGKSCVKQFNGMFAFVIYDAVNNELFGARDRLGKKPFYYYHRGKNFEFSSQPSPIKIERNLQIDLQSVQDYLIWGYVAEPRSIWQEIKQIPAGHSFTFYLNSGALTIKKYWDLDYDRTNLFAGNYEDAKIELQRLVSDAVGIRLNADVPLGIFLSGGIDSSLIAAIASKKVNHLKTFSIRFNDKGFDESKYASNVANFLKTEHHTIDCNYQEGIQLIHNFSTYYDEPFADSSAIPTMLLSKYTKKEVTVALSGDGGDEAFMGYSRYKWINMVNKLFKIPVIARKTFGSLINLSPNYVHKLIGMGISIQEIEVLYIKMFGGLENSWILDPEQGMSNPHLHILQKQK